MQLQRRFVPGTSLAFSLDSNFLRNIWTNWFGTWKKGENMKKFGFLRVVIVFFSLVAFLLGASVVEAKEQKNAQKPAVVKVAGTLSVTMNEKKKVTAIEVTDESGETFHIVVNKKSQKKAKKLDGKKVNVAGKMNAKLSKKNGGKWIVLKTIKATPAAAEK